jgi:hypothetical protein
MRITKLLYCINDFFLCIFNRFRLIKTYYYKGYLINLKHTITFLYFLYLIIISCISFFSKLLIFKSIKFHLSLKSLIDD